VGEVQVSHVLGLAGTIMVVAAYLPQLIHLERERCTGGLSRRAYVLWFVASLLILVHAIMVRDLVFVALQSANAVATGIIVVLTGRYKDRVCATHLHRFTHASSADVASSEDVRARGS
jgi:uncharacterized protein with PQ loop repeat